MSNLSRTSCIPTHLPGHIGSVEKVTLNGITNACCYLAKFEIETFDCNEFQRHRIEFPDQLKRAVRKRQAEFFSGRYCAALALNELGCEPCQIASGSHRQPLWPESISGSITHSQYHAAACITNDAKTLGIGIDIEKVIGQRQREAIVQTAINQAEHERLLRTAPDGELELLTLAFSAKESFFKAAFNQVGRYFDFSALEIIALDQNRLITRTAEALHPTIPPGQTYIIQYARLNTDEIITWMTINR